MGCWDAEVSAEGASSVVGAERGDDVVGEATERGSRTTRRAGPPCGGGGGGGGTGASEGVVEAGVGVGVADEAARWSVDKGGWGSKAGELGWGGADGGGSRGDSGIWAGWERAESGVTDETATGWGETLVMAGGSVEGGARAESPAGAAEAGCTLGNVGGVLTTEGAGSWRWAGTGGG